MIDVVARENVPIVIELLELALNKKMEKNEKGLMTDKDEVVMVRGLSVLSATESLIASPTENTRTN